MDTQENYNELKQWWTTERYVAIEIRSILLSDKSLRCLWRAIDLAIGILFKSCAQETPGQECTHTEDEHVLMFLGCRAFTSSLSALKLLFSGYYQQALAIERDLLETTLLLQWFTEVPSDISVWRKADSREWMKKFSPKVISEKLDKLGIHTRYDVYREYCDLVTHPTPRGRVMIWKEDRGRVGPFFDQEKARIMPLHITLNVCDACYNVLHALNLTGQFADEWLQIETCIDEWNSISPVSETSS